MCQKVFYAETLRSLGHIEIEIDRKEVILLFKGVIDTETEMDFTYGEK